MNVVTTRQFKTSGRVEDETGSQSVMTDGQSLQPLVDRQKILWQNFSEVGRLTES